MTAHKSKVWNFRFRDWEAVWSAWGERPVHTVELSVSPQSPASGRRTTNDFDYSLWYFAPKPHWWLVIKPTILAATRCPPVCDELHASRHSDQRWPSGTNWTHRLDSATNSPIVPELKDLLAPAFGNATNFPRRILNNFLDVSWRTAKFLIEQFATFHPPITARNRSQRPSWSFVLIQRRSSSTWKHRRQILNLKITRASIASRTVSFNCADGAGFDRVLKMPVFQIFGLAELDFQTKV